ncbi:MAG: cytochrome c-type biogenesis protein CcmH [Oceanospirillaceae bacterium]|nr:cytochrome c-type biogenesis protein CcmH [Oceanospirillaceae bacterium]
MKWLCLTFVLFMSNAFAVVDGYQYQFENAELQARFDQLANDLRCPKCQNQNLADSHAQVAADLRKQLYQQIEAGKDDQQILDYMVERYGDFVLYRPRVNTMTYVLWFGPALLGVVALLTFIVIVVRRRKNTAEAAVQELDDAQRDRLNALLQDNKND